MSNVTYNIVEHDGGWAYMVGDVYSETFATHDDAFAAAKIAAAEQQTAGKDEMIEYQDKHGEWRVESAKGGDRPSSDVEG